MNKVRQKYLQQWLRAQQEPIKKLMRANIALATLSALILVAQTYFLATLLDKLIMQNVPRDELIPYFLGLIIGFGLRAIILWVREKIGFRSGQLLRNHIRQKILDKIHLVGPATINQKPAGSWASIMLEQVENLHNFYARFLPQQSLSAIVPVVIFIAVFPLNWAAGLILMITAPLVPLFMIIVGIAAADNSQKNMDTLSRLSAQFLDRLRGLETLRLFNRTSEQTEHIENATEDFRETTMDVLKLAFLSSAVLEFFTSISIALMAVYFGFSYLGQIEFGTYNAPLTLFTGFFCLILAPEFYQPLRDLGTYYHDRAAGIGAANAIVDFLEEDFLTVHQNEKAISLESAVEISAENLVVLSTQGSALTQPLNFQIPANHNVALVGQSGAGKTSLINAILGFLPYKGSLKINGQELRESNLADWRKHIAWVGQNPLLLQGTIKENLLLGDIQANDEEINQALMHSQAKEFTDKLGLHHEIKDGGLGISVGQAQRLAIARALLRKGDLLLLDEPTASLDAQSENLVLHALNEASQHQTTLMITHRIEDLKQCDQIFVMQRGEIVQQGKFAELQHEGFFAELLAQRQQDIQ
ncbi:cysteine/glutathione ABC transporter membrane/ATP-binding component [Haemophilus influenzae 3655]|uniref:Cysteine/glutathione ABC transporter membrane/ATP-binding component n=1 Tax=Haemophilus influenzae (strain NTHi 3655) TaxID=375177 RepID=A0A0H3PM44_HAEI3|nr:cysteine/glutathione ABC transporter permease/ATP-binding protein CydD [Haemophilus influenzae]EDJ92918.1 cysteine/glutathione ABC transporter membrane/ATP-binding component [Haemophilus influenzae 3655]KOR02804.1 cysteine ABC transporter ATP-binding protein [Haemophilus influenzae]MCC3182463.1 cysteine/glutathione ABC transporter permease/ATP-binding protein CydD [Haemophilus influenzae]MCK8842415.1 cysteine/glutathione ABC transporter permease/ATP-binding protein CydD [Haemophilus influenz